LTGYYGEDQFQYPGDNDCRNDIVDFNDGELIPIPMPQPNSTNNGFLGAVGGAFSSLFSMIFNNAIWAIFIAILIIVILYMMFHKKNEGVVVNVPEQ
jgi:hypothetical protein